MRLGSKWAIFSLSLLAGFLFVMGVASYDYWQHLPKTHISILKEDIGVSPQINADVIPEIAAKEYATIIDLRPDGEVNG